MSETNYVVMIDWLPACGKQTGSSFFNVSTLKQHSRLSSIEVMNCVYDEQSFSNNSRISLLYRSGRRSSFQD